MFRRTVAALGVLALPLLIATPAIAPATATTPPPIPAGATTAATTMRDINLQLDGASAAVRPSAHPRAGRKGDLAVRVELIGRDGKPGIYPSEAILTNLDVSGSWYYASPGDELQLPSGRYAAIATVFSPIKNQWRPAVTAIALPEFRLDSARTLTLDARHGQRVDLTVDQPDAQILDQRLGVALHNHGKQNGFTGGRDAELYAVPTTGNHPELDWFLQAKVEKPLASLAVTAPQSFKVPVTWVLDDVRLIGRYELEVIDVGHARPEDLAGKDLHGKLAVFTLSPDDAREYGERVTALANAGAKAAVLYLTELLKVTGGAGRALPVLRSIDPSGSRLAQVGTRATLEGIADSPYQYNLAIPQRGAIPAGRTYHPADRTLATVQTNTHALSNDRNVYTNTLVRLDDLEMFDFNQSRHNATTQTRYYSPSPIAWSEVLRNGLQVFRAPETSYPSGNRQTTDWSKGVLAPTLSSLDRDGNPLAARTSDSLTVNLPLRSDSAGHAGFVGPDDDSFDESGDTSLYADGQLVGRSGQPGTGTFQLPAKPTQYKLISEVTRTNPELPLSDKVTAEWTFRSATGQTILPLLAIGFDPKLDLQNSAPRGKAFTFPITVHRQLGATGGPATIQSVDASYDDGATWHPAQLNPNRTVTVNHPTNGAFVSLRATAADKKGNVVTVTIRHAYRLR